MTTLVKSNNPVKAGLLLTLLMMTVWLSSATAESMEGDGLIVRIQSADLVFIDRGSENGVTPGDLYEIISSEMLVHPLSDSILAVTPKSVGSLRILQVYPRTALARLLQLDRGEDPMLKPIERVVDGDRRSEIEKMMLRGVRMAAGVDVPRRIAVIPGLYQTRIGETRKGWGLLVASGASLIGGFAYRSNSNDWYDQYQNLPAGLPESDYSFYFTKAQDRRSLSNNMFWLAGALYVYNWVDVLWLGDAAGVAYQASPSTRLHVDLGIGQGSGRLDSGLDSGLAFGGSQPLLRLTHRF